MSCRLVLVSFVMVLSCRSNDAPSREPPRSPPEAAPVLTLEIPACEVPSYAFGDMESLRAARLAVDACNDTLAQLVAANPSAAENPAVVIESERLRKLKAKIGLAILVKESEQSRDPTRWDQNCKENPLAKGCM